MFLSVLIPCYGAEKTLPRLFASLFSQNAPFDWEIVAVDDGSPDHTAAVLSAFAEKSPVPMRVIEKQNGGVASARNAALKAASGEFVTYADADDYLLPGAFFKAWDAVRKSDCDLLVFDAVYAFENGETKPYPASTCAAGAQSVREFMLSEPAPWNKWMKKSLFEGKAFPDGIWYEDFALIPTLGGAARRIEYLKEPLYAYVQTPSSITRGAFCEKYADILAAAAVQKALTDPIYHVETEFLAAAHFYRTFVWKFREAGRRDLIRALNAFMKKEYPRWRKNPLVRERFTASEKMTSLLFWRDAEFIINVWKGKRG